LDGRYDAVVNGDLVDFWQRRDSVVEHQGDKNLQQISRLRWAIQNRPQNFDDFFRRIRIAADWQVVNGIRRQWISLARQVVWYRDAEGDQQLRGDILRKNALVDQSGDQVVDDWIRIALASVGSLDDEFDQVRTGHIRFTRSTGSIRAARAASGQELWRHGRQRGDEK